MQHFSFSFLSLEISAVRMNKWARIFTFITIIMEFIKEINQFTLTATRQEVIDRSI